MATHDYVIDNQSAPAFRSDLNNALLAIVSQNSNATAPATTYANMIWYDTTNNQIKKRNEANSAWITLGTVDESTGRFTPTGSSDTGAVTFFATSTAPAGWLKANGALVSRTTYAALFSVIGTTFGVGDGSTTFALPDLRGEFPRGWDDGRGVDSGRSFGSAQLDQMQKITGMFQSGRLVGLDSFDASGALFHDFGPTIERASGSGTSNRRIGFDSALSPNARVSSTTAGETRPRNIALLACIKF